ncbi:MAG: ATP-binding cassette domain-containing protein, partial [Nocardiopsaceae bacterium]|nr:ATP-binding cassette domain-containing protein [Nocardiopsaceae bacterium]
MDGQELEIDGLRRQYGAVTALDGLTFGVPAGEVFGFLGPNGSGKTTTMRAVFGVTALDAGEIRWRGRPVNAAARRGFGYMPEERGLYPSMELLDQVVYFAELHGMRTAEAGKAARYWIERLGLEGRERTRIDALSHGNQQRAQLAVALVHDPELLVLDEPFSGLDPGGIDDMSAVLAERAAAGVTVLFSSHQLDLVEDICQAVAIIHHGRLIASGPVADLRRGDRPRLAVRVAGDRAAAWAAGIGTGSTGT